jgi:hypothetical protein
VGIPPGRTRKPDRLVAIPLIRLPTRYERSRTACAHFRAPLAHPRCGRRVPVAPLSISLVAMYLAGFGTSAYLTRRVRPAVRTLVVSIVGYGDQAEIHGNSALLARQTNALDHMDDDLHSGLITPLEYEERWWEVYDEMPERTVATRRVSGRLAPRR